MAEPRYLPFSIHFVGQQRQALLTVYAPQAFWLFDRPQIEMLGPDGAEAFSGCLLHTINDDGVHWVVGAPDDLLPLEILNQPYLTVLIGDEKGTIRHSQAIEMDPSLVQNH